MAAMSLFFMAAFLQIGGFVVGQGSGQNQLQTPASTTAEKDKCIVSGRVTSLQTGEPLKKVNLQLVLQQNGRRNPTNFQQTGYSGISAADGTFKFEGVEPGEYTLQGERTGYVRTSYGSKSLFSQGTTISLKPGQQLSELKFQLIQAGTISGRVLDEDGDPVGGLQIQALGRVWVGQGKARYFPQGNATTDDTGAFRISNLQPGKYYVSASSMNRQMGMVEKSATPGKPTIEQVKTYYPSSLDRAGASAVEIAAGQEMPGVEIHMRAVETFHIRGKVAGEGDGKQGQPHMLLLTADGDDDMFSAFGGMTMIGQDHTFDIAHVRPGSYTITMPNFGDRQETGRLKVEVGSADVNGLVLTPQATFNIRGTVELQGIQPKNAQDKPAENISVILQPDGEMLMMSASQAQTKADGTFTLEKVAPEKMKLRLGNEPEGSYIKSIRFGSQEVLGKPLDLTQSSGGEMHIVIRGGAPEISGTVMVKQGDNLVPAASANVLLIPEDLTANGGDTHSTSTNQNGGFTEKGMSPGTYYVVAFDSGGEIRNYEDPAVLKQLVSKATKVEVKENDKKQVQLTMLGADELQAALTAAGVEN